MKNWLKVRFIAGFFVTVPAFLTAWLLWIFWSRIDDVFAPMYQRILGRAIPGLGFLTAVGIILMMGTIARNVVGRRVLAWGDKLLLRVPIYRRLYPSVKMLIDSFSPERRSAFGAVVLVEHPRQGEYAFGFVTSHVVASWSRAMTCCRRGCRWKRACASSSRRATPLRASSREARAPGDTSASAAPTRSPLRPAGTACRRRSDRPPRSRRA